MVKTIKHIRFYITENCNAKCNNCFNSSNRTNAEMTITNFSQLCAYFKYNGIKHLKIMGGEPTIHPYFLDFINIAQKNFDEITIFTNAINDSISSINLRENDKIVYNFKFAKVINSKKLLVAQLGKRALEVQILKNLNVDVTKNNILRIFKLFPKIEVYLTLDCTINIFSERDSVIPIYQEIQEFCRTNGIRQGQDHILPLCYVRGTQIPLPKSGALCNIECAGLIDSQYNIRFCNQDSHILGNMYNTDNQLIKWESLVELFYNKFIEIHNELYNTKCRDCAFWNVYCNGGCFRKIGL